MAVSYKKLWKILIDTFPFSKKVLDRANTIEFSFVNLMAKATAGGKAVAQKLDNNFLKTEYLYLRDCDDEELISRSQ